MLTKKCMYNNEILNYIYDTESKKKKKTNTPAHNKSDDSADEDVVANDSLLIKMS